jgi:PAS domain S-box-containing protein
MQDAYSDRSIKIEVEYYHKNGSIVWMENSVKAIRDRSGSIIGMYGASRDITDRKKAEMVIERFFEQPMNIHIIAGFEGLIHKVNRGWQTILGYSENEVEGTNFFDLVHSEDRDSTDREMEKLGNGETTFYFENRYRHKNGSYRLLAWSATVSLEDKLVYAVASDITERQRET